jgi:hypothetical protein
LPSGQDPSIFPSSRSANFAAANSGSSQIASTYHSQIIIGFIVEKVFICKQGRIQISDKKKKTSLSDLKSDVVALPIHESAG